MIPPPNPQINVNYVLQHIFHPASSPVCRVSLFLFLNLCCFENKKKNDCVKKYDLTQPPL